MGKNRIDNDEFMYKNVAGYQTFLSAWISNRMERNRQIMTLSTAAIGLLSIFRNDINIGFEMFVWVLASFLFFGSILMTILIYIQNTKFIGATIFIEISNSEDGRRKVVKLEQSLRKKELWSFVLFGSGALSTIVFVMANQLSRL